MVCTFSLGKFVSMIYGFPFASFFSCDCANNFLRTLRCLPSITLLSDTSSWLCNVLCLVCGEHPLRLQDALSVNLKIEALHWFGFFFFCLLTPEYLETNRNPKIPKCISYRILHDTIKRVIFFPLLLGKLTTQENW